MSATPLLSIKDLRVEYATADAPVVAVSNVSFDVAEGEFVGGGVLDAQVLDAKQRCFGHDAS